MSFDGDLEHLPIVDVIQLLHATGKSGTLSLRGEKGESQLVFHNGYIVSANHVNNSVRIGRVLLDMGLVSQEELESALQEQLKAGHQRKPIIQTLIEGGRLHQDGAYQGLEVLIEMTIVEVLTWTKGSFSLDVNKIHVSDEYRYFPEQLKQEIQLNTQNVLMDALRIYDERKRDGTLGSGSIFGCVPGSTGESDHPSPELSAADLGLDELDELESKLPRLFSSVQGLETDSTASRLESALAGIPAAEQQRLIDYLDSPSCSAGSEQECGAVLLFTEDRVLREWVGGVCGPRFVCATSDAAGLDTIVDQQLSKGRAPLLLVDAGEAGGSDGGEAAVALLQQKRQKYPELGLVLLAGPEDFRLTTRALRNGLTAVLPKSSRLSRPDTFVDDTIDCAQALQRYLRDLGARPGSGLLRQAKRHLHSFADKREPSEITFSLLQSVGSFFDRAVTLVVVRSELVGERAIGIGAPGEACTVKLRIPIAEGSLFQKALEGESYFGMADPLLRETVMSALGAAASSKILLLPVKSFGRVIALIYADFGSRSGGAVELDLLEMLALHAGLVIDNALYRKRCAQKTA